MISEEVDTVEQEERPNVRTARTLTSSLSFSSSARSSLI